MVCICDCFTNFITVDYLGPPIIKDHPKRRSEVSIGKSIALTCKGKGQGMLEYSWEIRSNGKWTTISNSNTRSYNIAATLAIGEYRYRCRVNNDAGSVMSNSAIVNVYGEYCLTCNT